MFLRLLFKLLGWLLHVWSDLSPLLRGFVEEEPVVVALEPPSPVVQPPGLGLAVAVRADGYVGPEGARALGAASGLDLGLHLRTSLLASTYMSRPGLLYLE